MSPTMNGSAPSRHPGSAPERFRPRAPWLTAMLLILAALSPSAWTEGPPPAGTQLLAHWRFDEAAGNRASDSTGRHPGTLTGVAGFVPDGVAGGALMLGSSQDGSVRIGNVLGLTGGPYSISLWFKTPPGDTTPEGILIGKHKPWFENGYFIQLNNAGGTVWGFGGAGAYVLTQVPVNDGRWHHVVMSATASGTLNLHLDGGAPVATGQGGGVLDSPADLMIGTIDDPGPPVRRFNGWIDEVQIYDAALTQEAVDFLHTHPGLSLGQAGDLTISPPGGTVPNPVTVTLFSNIAGGLIRYSLDGSEPTLGSHPYSAPFPLAVTASTKIRVRVFLNGFPVSEIHEATFEPDPGIQFLPYEGSFTNQVEVSVQSSLSAQGVAIRLTMDGSEPTLNSPAYTNPVTVTNAVSLRARAFLNGFPVTEIITKSYQRIYVFGDDGIPAAWRTLYFGPDYRTDPRASANADPDHDDTSNLQEFTAGTHPLDPTSGFTLGVRAVPEIGFPSVPGRKYRILRRSSLSDPDPVQIAELTATAERTVYVDQDAGTLANPAFYLVAPVPAP